MTPDPERENLVRERVQALLASAPEPEPARLDVALEVARRATRRRQRRRQALAWLAAAAFLGAGAATAGWWMGSSDHRTDEPVEKQMEPSSHSRPSHGTDESGPNDAERNGAGGGDSGLIYQGVD